MPAVPLPPPEASRAGGEHEKEPPSQAPRQHEAAPSGLFTGPPVSLFSASTASTLASPPTQAQAPAHSHSHSLLAAATQTSAQTAHWLVLAAPVVLVSSLLVAVLKASKRRQADADDEKQEPESGEQDSQQHKEQHRQQQYQHQRPGASPAQDKKQDQPLTEKEAIVEAFNALSSAFTGSSNPASVPFALSSSTYTFPTPSQKRLRRVYTLHNNWPARPLHSAMDGHDRARMASTMTTDGAAALSAMSALSALSSSSSSPSSFHPSAAAPQPPPLPLSTSGFAFERPALDADVDGERDGETAGSQDSSMAFIHQPNPDYSEAATATATAPASASASMSTSTTAVADTAVELAFDDLPAAPPSPFTAQMGLRGGFADFAGAGTLDDGAGEPWTRHTRVYGGGVCLACLAAENSSVGAPLADDDRAMYGDNVPMEDRR